ncbi:hypothetical protein AB0L00_43255 [Actinoallomurus sp. NPDC052308]|uniref:HNH endonuclease n=1 Tax=Actinoallomurus sp. NPDC052308 TaxID=3155530 RepID=UPI0034285732
MKGRCELCDATDRIQVHQVRKLADPGKFGQSPPQWAQVMAKRRRKTLVVCQNCHDHIHNRQPTAATTQQSPESPLR